MPTAYSYLMHDEIASRLALDGFTESERDEIIDFLEENAIIRAHIDILDALKPEDRDRFYQVSEKRNREALQEFLSEKLPDYKDIVRQAAVSTVEKFLVAQCAS